MKKRSLQRLKRLTEACGLPGYEDAIAAIIEEEMRDFAKISRDRLGSVICEKAGRKGGPRIMLPGHMDEVGLMVKSVTEEGFIRFIPVGGWSPKALLAQRVTVKTAKGEYAGVIGCKAPHVLSEDERRKPVEMKDMFIDIGVKDRDEAEKKFGVRPGDPIFPHGPFTEMANRDYMLAKAFDDRVGCALFMDVIEGLQGRRHPNVLCGVGTVQEEVGLRGAKTAAAAMNPDVCICLDVDFAEDTPGEKDRDAGALGGGPHITVYDGGTIPNARLRDLLLETAKRLKIPHQLQSAEFGGTDADRVHLHGAGVPSINIGIPTRYMHTGASVVHKADYDAALRLLLAVIGRLDARTVARL